MTLWATSVATVFISCSSSSDDKSDFDEFTSAPATLRSDVDRSDLENYVECALKVEYMRLEFYKMGSNNYEGDLLSGFGEKSDPTQFYKTMAELLESRSRYMQAITSLDNSGILGQVTTRGSLSGITDFFGSLWDVGQDEEDRIKDALEKNKVMGDSKAQQQLFEQLNDWQRSGETNAQTWFRKFNNGEYTTKAPAIMNTWYNSGKEAAGAGDDNNAVYKFYDAYNGNSDGEARWKTVATTGATLAEKGASMEVSIIDDATGGTLGKMQDAQAIYESTQKLRDKINNGTATTSDLKAWFATAGSAFVKEKIGNMLDSKDFTEKARNQIISEITDNLCEKAIDQSNKDAADKLGKNVMEVINNLSNTSIGAVISVDDATGRTTIGFPGKDGTTTIVSNGDTQKTVTTVTNDGKRSTQKAKGEKGKTEINAVPDPENPQLEVDPASLTFDGDGGTEVFTIYTNLRFGRISTDVKWLKVSRNASNVIVEADPNESDEVRTGKVTVEMSADGETIAKSVVVPVTQTPNSTGVADFDEFDFTRMAIYISGSTSSGMPATSIPYARNKDVDPGTIWVNDWFTSLNVTGNKAKKTLTITTKGSMAYAPLQGEGEQSYDIAITLNDLKNFSDEVETGAYECVVNGTVTWKEYDRYDIKASQYRESSQNVNFSFSNLKMYLLTDQDNQKVMYLHCYDKLSFTSWQGGYSSHSYWSEEDQTHSSGTYTSPEDLDIYLWNSAN